MKYLLDTCALLWLAEGNTKLSANAFTIVSDPDNVCYVSALSFWELSMKAVAGKLAFVTTPSDLERMAVQEGLTILPLTVSHTDKFHILSTVHRDPFDRLIAAVALSVNCTVLSPDPAFDVLGARRTW